MIIKRIELENFRIYRGQNVIDFSPEADQNIYVVSGKNGFGKTTFLMSLVWCLYGRQMEDVDDLYKREISEQGGYSKYIVNSLNRQARAEEASSFSVTLVIADAIIPELTCSEISIKRSYNIKTASETVEILIDGFENELIKSLKDDKNRGEENFIRDYLLPIEIAKFFFFDAEKIVSLAEVNTPEQRRRLSKAYSEILGIKKYEDAKIEIEQTQLRIRARSASTLDTKQLEQLEVEIEDSRLSIASKQEQISGLEQKRVELKYESDEIQKKLIRIGNLITVEQLEVLRQRESVLTTKLGELQDELAKSYDLVPFAIAANKLSQVIEQAKSEAEYKESTLRLENVGHLEGKVLADLAGMVEQAGSTLKIDETVREFYNATLQQLLNKHLGSDRPAFAEGFELIHDFTDTEQASLRALADNLRLAFKAQFKHLNYQYNATRNELAQVKRSISDAESLSGDAIVKADRDTKMELDNAIDQLIKDIGVLEAEIAQLELSIVQKDKTRAEIGKRLKASEQDQEKDRLTVELAQHLQEYIAIYKDRKKESLEKKILDGLKMLMHKRGFVSRVRVQIQGEDIDIELIDKRGQVIPKEGLSKGEQQLYATALLYGLVEESDFDFPVFIDSPMQKFDDQHAENIVRHFYPFIADQVILFPLINKELSLREYELLRPKVARSYLIINKDSDQSGFEEVAPERLFERYAELYHS